MITLKGKKFAILGVANEKSIGWGIATALHAAGAELAFSYVNEAIEKRVKPLAESLGCKHVYKCDVQSDQDIDSFFQQLGAAWPKFDGIVHSIAYADRNDLMGRFVDTSRDGFKLALDVSAYSLVAIAKRARTMLTAGGSLLTLSYLGAERAVPHYNVMGVAKAALEASVRYLALDLGGEGIRVNAISAGPIKTLAASGIPHFREMLAAFAATAPLKRNVSQEDVAGAALFYLSALSGGITGEVTYVDCGYSTIGLPLHSSAPADS